jgi:hypothetical protein
MWETQLGGAGAKASMIGSAGLWWEPLITAK